MSDAHDFDYERILLDSRENPIAAAPVAPSVARPLDVLASSNRLRILATVEMILNP